MVAEEKTNPVEDEEKTGEDEAAEGQTTGGEPSTESQLPRKQPRTEEVPKLTWSNRSNSNLYNLSI